LICEQQEIRKTRQKAGFLLGNRKQLHQEMARLLAGHHSESKTDEN